MTNIVGLIRFSVLSTVYNPFSAAGGHKFNDYVTRVMDAQRLERRFALFEFVTLPSLDSQTDRDFIIVVVSSRLLPSHFRKRLDRIVASRRYLRCVYVDETDFRMRSLAPLILSDIISSSDTFITFRLDDDDAVAANFIERCKPYISKSFVSHCVSFCSGYYLDIGDNAETLGLQQKIVPNVSVGLSYVSDRATSEILFSVSDRHKNMHKRRPVIVDAREPSFVLVTHGENDTGGDRLVANHSAQTELVEMELQKSGFTIDLVNLRKALRDAPLPVVSTRRSRAVRT